jgi:acetyl-CoA carboxylase carboxyltransferase component
MRNHAKTDRLLGIALENQLPVVLFAEGGGGRPGDTDMPIVAGLHVPTFASFARLSGQVPVVGIASGRCFAGNAALLGCSDVIIATRNSNIGMGGPAMVEGGGLGTFHPEEIGPSAVQHANGVIDVLVDDEAQATAVARHYLSFFQGTVSSWQSPDPMALRAVVPENRLRVYDTRAAMAGLVDCGSLLPLRTAFGVGIHTALARIEGRPVGLLANNPAHLGGAIDAEAADKAARFMQLCNAHGLPIVSLCGHAGLHGGSGCGSASPGAACQPLVCGGGPFARAHLLRGVAQGLRTWRHGHGRGWFPCTGFHSGLAHGRVWWHGVGGRGPAGLSQGA